MGRHNAARTQRMDLLGRVREEAGDATQSRRADPHRTQRGQAAAVLLAGLSASAATPVAVNLGLRAAISWLSGKLAMTGSDPNPTFARGWAHVRACAQHWRRPTKNGRLSSAA